MKTFEEFIAERSTAADENSWRAQMIKNKPPEKPKENKPQPKSEHGDRPSSAMNLSY
jgi:hypothetical protein